MDKKTTRFNIVHGDDEYEIPEECEAAEEAAEELAKTNLEEHYSFINLLSIAVIMLFACIFFISVSGSDIVEDNNLSGGLLFAVAPQDAAALEAALQAAGLPAKVVGTIGEKQTPEITVTYE